MNDRFKILGINDERSFCECCGKTGLQKVVWIEDTETGHVGHFGCVCACKPSKCFGVTKQDLAPALKHWKGIERAAWCTARRIYKEKGGTYTTHFDDKGQMSHASQDDRPLWLQCAAEGMARVKAMLGIQPVKMG